ncbi:MAG: NADH-quinone oxidoreductase subunit NuoE [Dehalococcoidales bacterium]|nr:NADH-quinone oxidoreductase subunit NuoE [Dehalococcoidales bacterium]
MVTTQELAKTDQIIDKYGSNKSALIQILLEIQRENNWVSKETLEMVSEKLGITLAQVYHVATFYKNFSLVPRGKHILQVCLGTPCHTAGASRLLEKVEEVLNVQSGGTTEDQKFTLKTAYCFGCCALSPCIRVDHEVYAKVKPARVPEILGGY